MTQCFSSNALLRSCRRSPASHEIADEKADSHFRFEFASIGTGNSHLPIPSRSSEAGAKEKAFYAFRLTRYRPLRKELSEAKGKVSFLETGRTIRCSHNVQSIDAQV